MNAIGMVERADLEKALREFTGYQADAAQDAGLMVIIDAYAAGLSEELGHTTDTVLKAYLHTLTTLAEHLLDTGGRVVLAPEPAPPAAPRAPAAKVTGDAPAAARPGTFFNEDGTITCRTCGIAKNPDDFHKDSKARTGRKSLCRLCHSETRTDRKR